MHRILETLATFSRFGGITDLFNILPSVLRDSKYQESCRRRTPSEGLVVDTLAYYNHEEKAIVVCKDFVEESVRTHRIDVAGCYEAFVLHVLLHEHVHYVIDALELLKQLSGLDEIARVDEPFCEYIALRSIATGVYRVFGYEKHLGIPDMRACVPLIAALYRPRPYSLFRELYAIPSEVFSIKAEEILLSLAHKISRLETVLKSRAANPAPTFLLRLALLARLSRTEIIDVPTLSRIAPVRVVVI